MLPVFVSGNDAPCVENKIPHLMNKMPHILLIDDDDIFIFVTKKMLISTNLVETIDVCRSAADAMQFISGIDQDEAIPDIIFLDLNMPGMNGWEFLEYYQSLLPKMNKAPQLYVVSSSIADNDYEKAMNIHGVSGYLAKPLQAIQLKVLLQEIIW